MTNLLHQPDISHKSAYANSYTFISTYSFLCTCTENTARYLIYTHVGTCTCAAGFTGTLCQNRCKKGFFGQGCNQSCDCVEENTVDCDPATGHCNCKPELRGLSNSRSSLLTILSFYFILSFCKKGIAF